MEENNPDIKRKILIVFDDTITDIVFWSVLINQSEIQFFAKFCFNGGTFPRRLKLR